MKINFNAHTSEQILELMRLCEMQDVSPTHFLNLLISEQLKDAHREAHNDYKEKKDLQML